MFDGNKDNLPFDVDIEQALIGSVLIDNHWLDKVSDRLTGDHFYDPLHKRLYEAMCQVWAKGNVVTPLTMKPIMSGDKGLDEVGGYSYLVNLSKAAPTRPNVPEYARIIIELATKRSLIGVGEDLIAAALEKDDPLTAPELIEEAEKALYQVAEGSRFGQEASNFDQILDQSLKKTEAAMARGGKLAGVPSGLYDMDRLLGGFQSSDLIIVAGRPGMGKTSLATNIAFHAAKHDHGTMFFSLEMAAHQLGSRILSEQSKVEMWKMRNGQLTDAEWATVVKTSDELRQLPLMIDDLGAISVAQIAARARRKKRQKKLSMIIIDYLQLLSPGWRKSENRTQEVTEMTKGLKALAKELDVPIIALSQLSRGVDNREDKRPVLADLRESGSIEQDADIVMFVFREEYYLKHREPEPMSPEYEKWFKRIQQVKGKAEILVEKHRNGPTTRLTVGFEDKLTRFHNL